MKFSHYNKAWGNFKKYVIMPEIEELRKSGNLHDLAEKICYEWSIVSDDIKGDLIKTAAEAYAHDGIDKNAAAVIRLAGTENKKAVQIAADCQGAENELARLWDFLQFDASGCTLEESNDVSTPFGAMAQISADLNSGKTTLTAQDAQKQIFDTLPENEAKKLLEKRWMRSEVKAKYPQKYADSDRKLVSDKTTSADKSLLDWSLSAGAPPAEFAALNFLDPGNAISGLKLFEIMGDIQALLLFLIKNPERYPRYAFLDYFLFGIKYYPDDLDIAELLNVSAIQGAEASEFMTAVINLHTLKDSNSVYLMQNLADRGNIDATTALYAFDANLVPDAAEVLKTAAIAGSITAAYFLVRDFGEKNPEIIKLANLSVLSENFVNADGVKPERPFAQCRPDEDYKIWKEKIETLSPADIKRMSELWLRYAAENRFPEKLADIYAINIVLGKKLGQQVDDLLYKATALGSLDALLDLYDFFTEKNYPLYQRRLREIAMANYKLTPRQKVRLGLLKLVNV